MSQFLGHVSHPIEMGGCGSSDAVGVWEEDGRKSAYCFSCERSLNKLPDGEEIKPKRENAKLTFKDIESLPTAPLKSRGIKEKFAELYGVRVEYSPQDGSEERYYFPLRNRGRVVGWKVRNVKAVEKRDRFDGVGQIGNTQLFGSQLCGEKGKMLVITEGELDAVAAQQMVFDARQKYYRIVSIPDGSPGLNSIKRNLDWINNFDEIKLCYDQDEKGQEGAEKVAKLFQPGKCKIMKFSEKDANDMLKAGKEKEFLAAINNAQGLKIDGIVSGKDTWERINNRPPVESCPFPPDWEEVNKKTYGIRLGELDTFTGGSGSGKTQVFRELEYHILRTTQDNVGVISLEEPLEDSVEALMSLHLNKRIHLPDVRETLSEKELYEAWEATHGDNRVHYDDHFGSMDDLSLIAKIRFLAKGLDCKWIFLDHLSIVVSEFASEGGERERIDTAMSRLKKLTQELNIWIGLIVHLRKGENSNKSFENGTIPTLDDLRGSGSIKQLSNSVYAISRDQQDRNERIRNTCGLHVLKSRFTGDTGNAGSLYYDRYTGRMAALEEEHEQQSGSVEGDGTGMGEGTEEGT